MREWVTVTVWWLAWCRDQQSFCTCLLHDNCKRLGLSVRLSYRSLKHSMTLGQRTFHLHRSALSRYAPLSPGLNQGAELCSWWACARLHGRAAQAAAAVSASGCATATGAAVVRTFKTPAHAPEKQSSVCVCPAVAAVVCRPSTRYTFARVSERGLGTTSTKRVQRAPSS